jgi:dTDP-L-rhamnose 4-epimerase
MIRNILITGGAGFIGAHVANELLRSGYNVRALDSLLPQVHGPDRSRPSYLDPEVALLTGDVRDPAIVERALDRIAAVFHFVSIVGVGQSMYQIVE